MTHVQTRPDTCAPVSVEVREQQTTDFERTHRTCVAQTHPVTPATTSTTLAQSIAKQSVKAHHSNGVMSEVEQKVNITNTIERGAYKHQTGPHNKTERERERERTRQTPETENLTNTTVKSNSPTRDRRPHKHQRKRRPNKHRRERRPHKHERKRRPNKHRRERRHQGVQRDRAMLPKSSEHDAKNVVQHGLHYRLVLRHSTTLCLSAMSQNYGKRLTYRHTDRQTDRQTANTSTTAN